MPTYFNNARASDGSASAKTWRSVTRQLGLENQGIWIVSPDGKVLGGMSRHLDGRPVAFPKGNGPGLAWQTENVKGFARALRETMETALKSYGTVTPREARPEPIPYRGAGVRPDGGVRLVAYPGMLDRGKRTGPGFGMSVSLSKDEWSALTPPRPAVGTTWILPEAVARQFAPVLSSRADTIYRPKPGDAKVAELRAEVEAVEANQAQIRLIGKWETHHVHDGGMDTRAAATAEGIAVYDLDKKTMRSLLLVFTGTHGTADRRPKFGPADARYNMARTCAVLRWRLDGPAE